MAIPRVCCAAALILLLFAACGREETAPVQTGAPQGPGHQSPDGTGGEIPPSESAPTPDFIGMDLESFRHEIQGVVGVQRQARHLITYEDDGHEIIAMQVPCGSAYYVFMFADGRLTTIHETTYKLFAVDPYERLIEGLSALPSMSTDEFCADCHQEAQDYNKHREPMPILNALANLSHDPVASGLKKWEALGISLGDNRDRVESRFGTPIQSRVEHDETVLIYKTDPPAGGGAYLEVTIWLHDDKVTRSRTAVRWDPG